MQKSPLSVSLHIFIVLLGFSTKSTLVTFNWVKQLGLRLEIMKWWIWTTTQNGNALPYAGGQTGHEAGFTTLFHYQRSNLDISVRDRHQGCQIRQPLTSSHFPHTTVTDSGFPFRQIETRSFPGSPDSGRMWRVNFWTNFSRSDFRTTPILVWDISKKEV